MTHMSGPNFQASSTWDLNNPIHQIRNYDYNNATSNHVECLTNSTNPNLEENGHN